jgi:hypothetical protein
VALVTVLQGFVHVLISCSERLQILIMYAK